MYWFKFNFKVYWLCQKKKNCSYLSFLTAVHWLVYLENLHCTSKIDDGKYELCFYMFFYSGTQLNFYPPLCSLNTQPRIAEENVIARDFDFETYILLMFFKSNSFLQLSQLLFTVSDTGFPNFGGICPSCSLLRRQGKEISLEKD